MTTEYFSREELLTPVKRRFHEFPVRLNGSTKNVRIRSLTERERSAYELSGSDERGRWKLDRAMRMKCSLIALCVVDGDGNPLLSERDAEKLMEQDGSATGKLFDECVSHTGVDALSVEKTAKNSAAGDEPETSED